MFHVVIALITIGSWWSHAKTLDAHSHHHHLRRLDVADEPINVRENGKCCRCKPGRVFENVRGVGTCLAYDTDASSSCDVICEQVLRDEECASSPPYFTKTFTQPGWFRDKNAARHCARREDTCETKVSKVGASYELERKRTLRKSFQTFTHENSIFKTWKSHFSCAKVGEGMFDTVGTMSPTTEGETTGSLVIVRADSDEACLKEKGYTLGDAVGKGEYGKVSIVQSATRRGHFVAKQMAVRIATRELTRGEKFKLLHRNAGMMSQLSQELKAANLAARVGLTVPIVDAFVCKLSDDALVANAYFIMPQVESSLFKLVQSQTEKRDGDVGVRLRLLQGGRHFITAGHLSRDQLQQLRALIVTAFHFGVLPYDAHFENIMFQKNRFVLIDFGMAPLIPGKSRYLDESGHQSGGTQDSSAEEKKSALRPFDVQVDLGIPRTKQELEALETSLWNNWCHSSIEHIDDPSICGSFE